MFAVNGPSGPTQRNERRVRNDPKPTKEQLDAQRRKRETFFAPRAHAPNSQSTASDPPSTATKQGTRDDNPKHIFKGCRIYFNGRTGKVSSYNLAKLVQDYGGNKASEYKITRVTHIVACNLNGSKAEKVLKSCGKIKCVRPEWILQSVKQGKRLPEFDFLVYKPAGAAAFTTLAKTSTIECSVEITEVKQVQTQSKVDGQVYRSR